MTPFGCGNVTDVPGSGPYRLVNLDRISGLVMQLLRFRPDDWSLHGNYLKNSSGEQFHSDISSCGGYDAALALRPIRPFGIHISYRGRDRHSQPPM